MYTKIVALLIVSAVASVVSAQQNVVLLKNGNVLKGVVQRDGMRVEVRSSSGTLIIDMDSVDFFCESMEEAYRLRQASTDPNDLEKQVQLLRWCMKHKLYREAQEQIDVLQMLPIKATRLDYLNRQVNVAIAQQKRKVQQEFQNLQPRIAENPISPAAGEIAQVGYEQPIEIMPLPDAGSNSLAQPIPKLASKRDIEEFSKSFPGELVSHYKRKIEPDMIRNCSNAGCHNSSHEGFPLLNKGYGRRVEVPKLYSQRNFYRMMKFVNLDQPLESVLFQKATQPHGGQDEAAYVPNRKETKTLEQWLLSIATPEAQRAYQQKQFEIANAENMNLPGNSIPPIQETHVQQASAVLPDSSIPSVPNLAPRAQTFTPKDPFDPEIFNRKYGERD